MLFEYKEMTNTGQIKTGRYEGSNRSELVAVLKEKGSKPIDIKEIKSSS